MAEIATTGGDLGRASTSFSNSAEDIRSQAKAVAESRVTGAVTGRKFPEAGDKYRQMIEKLQANITAFAEHSATLSGDFSASAKEYDASDDRGSDDLRSVQA